MVTALADVPGTSDYSRTFRQRNRTTGVLEEKTVDFTYVEGTEIITAVQAAVMLDIEASSVRALVSKGRLTEAPRDTWPSGKCLCVYAVSPLPEDAHTSDPKIKGVLHYMQHRGPSRFRK